jgi:hypothetical protein
MPSKEAEVAEHRYRAVNEAAEGEARVRGLVLVSCGGDLWEVVSVSGTTGGRWSVYSGVRVFGPDTFDRCQWEIAADRLGRD